MNLDFYRKPFKVFTYGRQVYDAKNNHVFDFLNVEKFERDLILFRLNALNKNTEQVPLYELTYNKEESVILNYGEPFIDIRGWGNLTGTGSYNFREEKARGIQDTFAQWLIETLT